MLTRYIQTIQSHYFRYVIISLSIILIAASGVSWLSITNDFRIYFGEDNPQLKAFEQLEYTFGKQDTLYFFIKANKGDVFEPSIISLIWNLTDAA